MTLTPNSIPVPLRIVIDALIYLAGVGVLAVLFTRVEPTHLGFYCDDASIRKLAGQDTVSVLYLLIGVAAFPLCIIVVLEVLFNLLLGRRRSIRGCAQSIGKLVGMYMYGFLLCLLVTEVLKLIAGCLRPHFIDTCRPDFSQINCSVGYVMDFDCSNDVSSGKVRDARKSFPSGHASSAGYAATFLGFYLEERLTVPFSVFLKSSLQVATVLLASFCALSRIFDRRHHPIDVVAGSVLGVVIGLWVVFCVAKHMRHQSCFPAANKKQSTDCDYVILTDAPLPAKASRSTPEPPKTPRLRESPLPGRNARDHPA